MLLLMQDVSGKANRHLDNEPSKTSLHALAVKLSRMPLIPLRQLTIELRRFSCVSVLPVIWLTWLQDILCSWRFISLNLLWLITKVHKRIDTRKRERGLASLSRPKRPVQVSFVKAEHKFNNGYNKLPESGV